MRKFRERSEGECLLQTVNVNESQTGHVRETSPTAVGVRKFKESSGSEHSHIPVIVNEIRPEQVR